MEGRIKQSLVMVVALMVMFALTGQVWAVDTDGDGVDDLSDICSRTDPKWTVTAEGCADRDVDGVSDYMDQCPGSNTIYPINAIGCRENRYFRVLSSRSVYWLYPGSPESGRKEIGINFADGTDFVLAVPIDGMGGRANRLAWWDNPGSGELGNVWFRAHDDGTASLWDEGGVEDANIALGTGPDGSTFDLDPNHDVYIDPCTITTEGMPNPQFDGMTITVFEVFDSDEEWRYGRRRSVHRNPPGCAGRSVWLSASRW